MEREVFKFHGKSLIQLYLAKRSMGRFLQDKAVEFDLTSNPISQEHSKDALALIVTKFKDVPRSLRKKVSDSITKILGIGVIHNDNIACFTDLGSYTPEIVDYLIQRRLGFNDETFGGEDGAKYWVSNLILVRAVMSHLGFMEVVVVGTLGDQDVPAWGNTAGIVVESNYWSEYIIEGIILIIGCLFEKEVV